MLAEMIASKLEADGRGVFQGGGAPSIFIQRLPDTPTDAIGVFEADASSHGIPGHREMRVRIISRGKTRVEAREILASLLGWRANLPDEVVHVTISGPDQISADGKGKERWAFGLACIVAEGVSV